MKAEHSQTSFLKCVALISTLLISVPANAQVALVGENDAVAAKASEKAVEAQASLGRLFFTPTQRQRMDRARSRGEVIGDNGVVEEPPPAVLNGFVKRSDGQTMIWVDGRARYGVTGDEVSRLQPADVGGPSNRVQVRAESTDSADRNLESTRRKIVPKSIKPPAKVMTKTRSKKSSDKKRTAISPQ